MFEYANNKINYKDYGNKSSQTIVFLHGWGQNIAMMEPLATHFEKTHHLIIIDLPGFGLSPEPEHAWTLLEYVAMIEALLKSLNITNPILVGHSFGGKLSIIYASKYPTKKLVLLASPFKVKITKPSKKVLFLKKMQKISFLKPLALTLKRHLGSTDYKNATPLMRDVLVKHVNTDVTELAKKISCPTILIWGTNDTAVPINDGEELEKIISDCALLKYENCTHYAYLERLNQTVLILKSFFTESSDQK